MKTVIDIIKELRAAGFSQSEISRRTGIPQPRLSRWENGSPPVGANDVLRLARLLGEVGKNSGCKDSVSDAARAAFLAPSVASGQEEEPSHA
ncbi:MAG: helix-turn-helix domain-containing protein [Burkholderiaceae bacterium]